MLCAIPAACASERVIRPNVHNPIAQWAEEGFVEDLHLEPALQHGHEQLRRYLCAQSFASYSMQPCARTF